jgi:tetratricopeptide (TPR) repeat protein
MKNLSFVTFIAVVCTSLMITGFQCGSAESTSAKLYMQREEWDAAEAALTKEVENNPANGEAWHNLGQVRLRKGEKALDAKNYAQVMTDFENMVYSFDKSTAATPDFVEQIQTEKIFAWQKSLNAGVQLFNQSIKAPPDQQMALRTQAVQMYDVAIRILPDSVLPYKNAAIALQADNRISEALPYLQKARKVSTDPEILTSLIGIYMDIGDNLKAGSDEAGAMQNYNTALEYLSEARATSPDDPDIMNGMIDLYIKVGRASEAIPLMEEGLKKDPKNRDYQYNLGVLLMQAGKTEEALPHFEAALEVDPNYEFALQNAGTANLQIADKMKRAAQSDDPKASKNDKGYIEYFKKAVGYFKKLTELKPEDANAWDALGSAYANAGMVKEAQAAITKADELRKK